MPIVEDHPIPALKSKEMILWRYMDIPSFLSLLVNSSLTFVRADLMEDRFEGTITKPTAEILDLKLNTSRRKDKLTIFDIPSIFEQSKKMVYINCWCKENFQMVHMWKIYSKEKGIAIETSYEKLKNAFGTEENIYPAEINYLDFEKDLIQLQSNMMTPFKVKKKEYKAENEFRLLLLNPKQVEDQLYKPAPDEPIKVDPQRDILYSKTLVVECKVDISKLISKIHISPFAPKWYSETIKKIMHKYGFNHISVEQSEL